MKIGPLTSTKFKETLDLIVDMLADIKLDILELKEDSKTMKEELSRVKKVKENGNTISNINV